MTGRVATLLCLVLLGSLYVSAKTPTSNEAPDVEAPKDVQAEVEKEQVEQEGKKEVEEGQNTEEGAKEEEEVVEKEQAKENADAEKEEEKEKPESEKSEEEKEKEKADFGKVDCSKLKTCSEIEGKQCGWCASEKHAFHGNEEGPAENEGCKEWIWKFSECPKDEKSLPSPMEPASHFLYNKDLPPAERPTYRCEICMMVVGRKLQRGDLCSGLDHKEDLETCRAVVETLTVYDRYIVDWLYGDGCDRLSNGVWKQVRPCPQHAICSWMLHTFKEDGVDERRSFCQFEDKVYRRSPGFMGKHHISGGEAEAEDKEKENNGEDTEQKEAEAAQEAGAEQAAPEEPKQEEPKQEANGEHAAAEEPKQEADGEQAAAPEEAAAPTASGAGALRGKAFHPIMVHPVSTSKK